MTLSALPRLAIAIAATAGLGACGVVYTAPSVQDGSAFGAAPDTDFAVSVVPLTYETAASANLVAYVPQRLPSSFQPGVAARMAGPGLGPVDPLPQVPTGAAPSQAQFQAESFPPLRQAQPYRIGVADVLLLAVASPTTLDDLPGLIAAQNKRQGYAVRDDGAIAIPDVGRVMVEGLTLGEAEQEIFSALANAGIDPSFTLEIAEYNSKRVAVGGAVRAPTLIPITLKPLTLPEAIQVAGGIGEIDPARAQVRIFRGGEAYAVNVDRLLSDPTAQRIVLTDGDTIIVDGGVASDTASLRFDQQLRRRAQQLQTQNALLQREQIRGQAESRAEAGLAADRALFRERLELGAVARDYAYRTGEVTEPGRFPLPFERSASLADVLYDQRGFQIRFADQGEIYVIRQASDPALAGQLTAYHLDASNAVNLAVATRFEIRPNDVVFVAEQPVTSWNRVLSQILPSLFVQAANVASR